MGWKQARCHSNNLKASVKNNNLKIEVINTGKWIEPSNDNINSKIGTGTGLKNIRQRLENAFPDKHEFNISENNGSVLIIIEISNQSLNVDTRDRTPVNSTYEFSEFGDALYIYSFQMMVIVQWMGDPFTLYLTPLLRHFPLDTQGHFSYTRPTKKRLLIKQTKSVDFIWRRQNDRRILC